MLMPKEAYYWTGVELAYHDIGTMQDCMEQEVSFVESPVILPPKSPRDQNGFSARFILEAQVREKS